ncbi:MAG: hypothetical protein ACI4E1_10135 [Lachnospira sp.]
MDFYGSLCLSDIPKRHIKEVNGKKYLNIKVCETKEVGQYGDTHFVAVSVKKEDRQDGENTFIGHMKPFQRKVTVADIEAAPVAETTDDLPF